MGLFHHTICVFFLLLMLPALVYSEDQWPSGDEIAKRINARDEGNAVTRKVTMELIDRHGKTRLRETYGARKYFGEEKRTVIYYLSPKNIKGTAFLVYDYPDAEREDDQWLYLPALRRVRRISASNRGDYFLGTDFAYEEIKKETKVTIEDYKRKTLGVEEVDGHSTYLVEGIPVNEEIAKELGYSRVHQWIDTEIWMARKTTFWDLQGKLLKTEYFRDIKQVNGIWTIHQMEADNHKTGHKTRFTFKDVNYNDSISDDLFTQRMLKRGL